MNFCVNKTDQVTVLLLFCPKQELVCVSVCPGSNFRIGFLTTIPGKLSFEFVVC